MDKVHVEVYIHVRFVPNEQTTLCRREDGMILNINLSVYELGIRNGSQLMLI